MRMPVSKVTARAMLAAAVVLWLALVLAAQSSAPVTLNSQVDRSRITIGGVVHYSVQVRHAPGIEVRWPALGSNLGAFEIRDYNEEKPREEKGQIIEEVRYTISTFDTGKFVIPPLQIGWVQPPDTVVRYLKSEPIEITVASLKPSLAGDIRGLKPQAVLPRDWRRVAMLAGAGVLLLALAGGAYWYLRRQKEGEGVLARREPPRPAHEVALEKLAQLEAENLPEQGLIKDHFSRLSEILREYLENRYFMPALESTTFEILEHFRSDGQLGGQLQPLEQVLNLCDLVKFAKYLPAVDETAQAMERSRAFVESTKLIFARPEEEEGDGAQVAAAPQEAAAGAEEEKTQAAEGEAS